MTKIAPSEAEDSKVILLHPKCVNFGHVPKNEAVIRGIFLLVRPFNRCTEEVAILAEFHMFVDIT